MITVKNQRALDTAHYLHRRELLMRRTHTQSDRVTDGRRVTQYLLRSLSDGGGNNKGFRLLHPLRRNMMKTVHHTLPGIWYKERLAVFQYDAGTLVPMSGHISYGRYLDGRPLCNRERPLFCVELFYFLRTLFLRRLCTGLLETWPHDVGSSSLENFPVTFT